MTTHLYWIRANFFARWPVSRPDPCIAVITSLCLTLVLTNCFAPRVDRILQTYMDINKVQMLNNFHHQLLIIRGDYAFRSNHTRKHNYVSNNGKFGTATTLQPVVTQLVVAYRHGYVSMLSWDNEWRHWCWTYIHHIKWKWKYIADGRRRDNSLAPWGFVYSLK